MIRRLLPIKFGRMTPRQSTRFGQSLGSFGYVGVGPVLVMFNLPRALQVADPEVSLFDINAHFRELEKARQRAQD